MIATIQLRTFSHPVFHLTTEIKTQKTKFLLSVLYGCENLAFMLRDDHKLKVLENRMLRKILGPKRDKLRRLGKMHNEVHKLFFLPNEACTQLEHTCG